MVIVVQFPDEVVCILHSGNAPFLSTGLKNGEI